MKKAPGNGMVYLLYGRQAGPAMGFLFLGLYLTKKTARVARGEAGEKWAEVVMVEAKQRFFTPSEKVSP